MGVGGLMEGVLQPSPTGGGLERKRLPAPLRGGVVLRDIR